MVFHWFLTKDRAGDIVFPNCNHSHEAIGIDFQALVEEHVPSRSVSSLSCESRLLI